LSEDERSQVDARAREQVPAGGADGRHLDAFGVERYRGLEVIPSARVGDRLAAGGARDDHSFGGGAVGVVDVALEHDR